jgi:hypothetical protein
MGAGDIIPVVPQVGHGVEVPVLESSVERLVGSKDVAVVVDHGTPG